MTSDKCSIRFHLAYPRQAGAFSWAECACLARSLGYRASSIELCYRQAVEAKHQTVGGFQLAQLATFLGSDFFKSGFDFTYNSHSCEWNEQAIRRAFAVLGGRGMTFQQLYSTRVAYGLYESSDLRGLKAKPRTVMRALRACGRAISLGKLGHRVHHMRFHEPGRLQLDEFIDLALWAGPLEREEARSALPPAGSDGLPDPHSRLHQLVSFEDLLTPLDGRIQRRLDAEYRQEERRYVVEKLRASEPRLRRCPVQNYREARLQRRLEVRAGSALARRALRPISASVHACSGVTVVSSLVGDRDGDVPKEEEEEDMTPEQKPASARDDVEDASRRFRGPLVTTSDVARTELLKDALAFEAEASPELYERRTAENMQALRPGFGQRHAHRAETAAAEEAAAQLAADTAAAEASVAERRAQRSELQRQRQQRFVELAERPDPAPLPSHGRVCDAGRRGEISDDHGVLHRRRRPATASAAVSSWRRRSESQQQQHRAADVDVETSWLEPRLGLPQPLAPPTVLTVSRINYSSSCPPRGRPVVVERPANGEAADGGEILELIERTVYADVA